jgi:hypothetical protein
MIRRLIFKMMNEKIQGLFRHVLTFSAGILVTKGIVDEDMVLDLVGAIMTLTGFVWSFLSKKEVEK